jgi:hypothetical protein
VPDSIRNKEDGEADGEPSEVKGRGSPLAFEGLSWNPASSALPPLGELVLCRTEQAYFVGYRDSDGTWRDLKGTIPTLPIMAWTAVESEEAQ